MKGDKTQLVLEILAHAGRTAGELFDVFFATYHESYRRARSLGALRAPPRRAAHAASAEERNQFSNPLSKLKE